ncbi:hypothetical protein ABFS83_13G017500 [Erythranthe nasuta]
MARNGCGGGLRETPLAAVKSRNGLKKGPWTSNEDSTLIEYVKNHGEGNWNAVQRNSGLSRCGKSCRLRWANHLRPNLKKGAFSADEEKLIVELHAKYGNKWARMASQIPGRTDNEIKNYWNTRLKRRQRAGLPIYPHENHHKPQLNSSPPPQSSYLVSAHLPNPNPNPNPGPGPNPLSFYEMFTSPQNQPNYNTPYINNQMKLYNDNNNGSISLSLSASNSSFSSPTLSAAPFFNHGPLPKPSFNLQYNNSLNYGNNSGPDMGVFGLPSIQSPVASSSDFVMTTTTTGSSDCAEDYYEVETGFERCNKKSGLLEDLLGESQALAGKTEDSFIAEDGNLHANADNFGFDEGAENKASGEGGSSMDDDLLNLLDNFPLSVPIPNWDEEIGNDSPGLTDGTNGAVESQLVAPQYNPVANSNGAANQDWNFGGSFMWNNMPSIY